jgi:acyl-CoA thioester hydrolase
MRAHRYFLRVYYEDTDAGGVVYHANYLRFAERARTEAMRAAGVPHSELAESFGLSFMVQRIEMEYLRPARLDDALEVVTESLAMGAATVQIRQSFVPAGQEVGEHGAGEYGAGEGREPLAVAHLRLACVRIRDGRPGRIPDRWRQALAPEAEGVG